VDVKRAADELGFAKDRWRELRELAPGSFFGFGPALSRSVMAVKVGAVETTHPKAGARLAFTAPPPTEKVKALLPKLADLPAEAEQRQRTVADLQTEVAGLKRRLREAEKAPPPAPAAPKAKRIEVPVWKEADLRRLEAAGRLAVAHGQRSIEHGQRLIQHGQAVLEAGRRTPTPVSPRAAVVRSQQTGKAPGEILRRPTAVMVRRRAEPTTGLPVGERRVLTAIAQHGDAGVTREQLSILTGYKRSSRDTYLQRLQGRAFVAVAGDRLEATGLGLEVLGPDFEPLPTGDALRDYWLARLPEGERRVLEVLVAAYPTAVERTNLDEPTGYKRSSRDTYLQRLGARKLVVTEGRGAVRAAEGLFG
jgi:hypothetical protein